MMRIRPKQFQACIRQIKRQLPGLIVSAYELGVSRGERGPGARDMDMFVLTRRRSDIPYVLQVIHHVEQQTLHVHRAGITTMFEQAVLDREAAHIHVLAIGRDELSLDYRPRSLRLRLTTLFVSRGLLAGYFKRRARLLFGKRLPQRVTRRRKDVRRPFGLFGRWGVCFAPMAMALLVPLMRLGRDEFRVWCFKIIWYQSDMVITYLRAVSSDRTLAPERIALNHDTLALATEYRYRPYDYYGSRLGLYAVTWRFMFSNLPFLWRGRRYIQPLPVSDAADAAASVAAATSTPQQQQDSAPSPVPVSVSSASETSAPEPPATSSAK